MASLNTQSLSFISPGISYSQMASRPSRSQQHQQQSPQKPPPSRTKANAEATPHPAKTMNKPPPKILIRQKDLDGKFASFNIYYVSVYFDGPIYLGFG